MAVEMLPISMTMEHSGSNEKEVFKCQTLRYQWSQYFNDIHYN